MIVPSPKTEVPMPDDVRINGAAGSDHGRSSDPTNGPDNGAIVSQPVYVTKPYLPPIDEFLPLLAEIWERRWLSNHGPFHQRFERALGEYLGAEHVSLTTNGMLALETALEASGLSGEIVTTPY